LVFVVAVGKRTRTAFYMQRYNYFKAETQHFFVLNGADPILDVRRNGSKVIFSRPMHRENPAIPPIRPPPPGHPVLDRPIAYMNAGYCRLLHLYRDRRGSRNLVKGVGQCAERLGLTDG
jgi:hypothetical protein